MTLRRIYFGDWPSSGLAFASLVSEQRLAFYCRTSDSTAPLTPLGTRCPYAYVLVNVPRVSRSCAHFSDGFDFHLLCYSTKGSGVRLCWDLKEIRIYVPKEDELLLIVPNPIRVPCSTRSDSYLLRTLPVREVHLGRSTWHAISGRGGVVNQDAALTQPRSAYENKCGGPSLGQPVWVMPGS